MTVMAITSMMTMVMMTVIAADNNRGDDDGDEDDDDDDRDGGGGDASSENALLRTPVTNACKQRLELVPLLALAVILLAESESVPAAVEKQQSSS